MAGPVGKSKLGDIFLQAKCASAAIRAERDRLLQLQLQLQAEATTPGDAARLKAEVSAGLVDVYIGLEAGARHLTTCLMVATSQGVPPSLPASFCAISDEQLFDELVALRLPARPSTQRHAFARVEAAFYAVKLPQEHHLDRCARHLDRAATEQPASNGGMDQARNYLDRACTLSNLAVTHTDLAVTAIASFLDPQDVASISSLADRLAMNHRSTR